MLRQRCRAGKHDILGAHRHGHSSVCRRPALCAPCLLAFLMWCLQSLMRAPALLPGTTAQQRGFAGAPLHSKRVLLYTEGSAAHRGFCCVPLHSKRVLLYHCTELLLYHCTELLLCH